MEWGCGDGMKECGDDGVSCVVMEWGCSDGVGMW